MGVIKDTVITVTNPVMNFAEKQKRDYIDAKGDHHAETNADAFFRRTRTAIGFGEETAGAVAGKVGGAMASGDDVDLIIGVPLVLGEQALKILDGLNNWIAGWDFSKNQNTTVNASGEKTGNIPGPKADKQTTNIPQPNANKQTTNIPKPNANDQTTNIPKANTDKQTVNIPVPDKKNVKNQSLKDVAKDISNAQQQIDKKVGTALKTSAATRAMLEKVGRLSNLFLNPQSRTTPPIRGIFKGKELAA